MNGLEISDPFIPSTILSIKGSGIIAALLEKRNCVAVERDPVLFIQSKVCAMDVLSPEDPACVDSREDTSSVTRETPEASLSPVY